MTKHSRHERAKRATETEQMAAIERAWTAAIPASVAADFAREVEIAQSRVYVRQPDMAPGTAPRPPRPGREPKPSKDEGRSRR